MLKPNNANYSKGCLLTIACIGFLLMFLNLNLGRQSHYATVWAPDLLLFFVLLIVLLTSSVYFTLSSRWQRWGKRTAWLTLGLATFTGMFWIGAARDLPTDYSHETIASLRSRIQEEERDIAEQNSSGSRSGYLDSDRWWPYDRDRTVLGMFLLREEQGRWPGSLHELRESGLVADKSSIHANWILVLTEKGWNLCLDPRKGKHLWKMGIYRNTSTQ